MLRAKTSRIIYSKSKNTKQTHTNNKMGNKMKVNQLMTQKKITIVTFAKAKDQISFQNANPKEKTYY